MYLSVVWRVISERYDRNYLEVCYETESYEGVGVYVPAPTRDIEFLSNFVDIFVEEVGMVSIDSLLNVCLSPSFGLLVVVDT